MKWLFKWLLRLVFVAVVLVVVLYFAKDLILREVAENRIRSQTGMEAQIGKFSSGRTGSATYVTLENLKLYNPAGFGGLCMASPPVTAPSTPSFELLSLHATTSMTVDESRMVRDSKSNDGRMNTPVGNGTHRRDAIEAPRESYPSDPGASIEHDSSH